MEESKQTSRLEAFSDGVFAIAITLLILDLRVPRALAQGQSLADALADNWPNYLAFLTSFATIGIMWINHNRMFTHVTRADNNLLILNGLLLMGVTFVPFPTSLIAEYLGHPNEAIAARVYTGTFVVLAILFNVLWRYASHHSRLLDVRVDRKAADRITRQYSVGPATYLAAFVITWINVPAAMALTLLLAIYFALPHADWFRVRSRSEQT